MADDTGMMTELHSLLRSVAAQVMNGPEVVIKGGNEEEQKSRVTRVGGGRLRTVRVRINGREIQAIEQNREKPSRWGQLARKGHQVVQFQDVVTRKYLAVVVDGEVTDGVWAVSLSARLSVPARLCTTCQQCTVGRLSGRFQGGEGLRCISSERFRH